MAQCVDLFVDGDGQRGAVAAMIASSYDFGFNGVAITHTIEARQRNNKRQKKKGNKKDPQDELLVAPRDCSAIAPFGPQETGGRDVQQYTRLHVTLLHQLDLYRVNQCDKVTRTYDIVSVEPTSDDLFEKACNSAECDIITIDLTQRIKWSSLKHKTANVALRRGVFFEIRCASCYARGQTVDRAAFISNAMKLISICRGRNIILSSGAKQLLDLRGAYDLVNLGVVLGLKADQAKGAISHNARGVLVKGRTRARTYRAVIEVEKQEKEAAEEEAGGTGVVPMEIDNDERESEKRKRAAE